MALTIEQLKEELLEIHANDACKLYKMLAQEFIASHELHKAFTIIADLYESCC